LFLLNIWVEDLSLRDLSDRIQMVSQDHLEQNKVFSLLLDWLMNRLSGSEFAVEDLRKLAVLSAGLLIGEDTRQQALSFFELLGEKAGKQRLRDFMELQLMHFPTEYAHFTKWNEHSSPSKAKNHKNLHDLRAKRKVHKAEEEDVEQS